MGGKPSTRDMTLEFKNKGMLKDQSEAELKKMFKEFLDSRLEE